MPILKFRWFITEYKPFYGIAFFRQLNKEPTNHAALDQDFKVQRL